MRTNLTVVTLVHNVVKIKYPWKYSILSALPICDQVIVVNAGPNDDGTTEELCRLAASRPYGAIKIVSGIEEMGKVVRINEDMNTANDVSGISFFDFNYHQYCSWPTHADDLSTVTNVGFDMAQTEWVMELQADEILAEWDYDTIINGINTMLPNMDAIMVWFHHFCGDLRHEFPFIYNFVPRICRKASGLRLFGDAFAVLVPSDISFGLAQIRAKIYHCGKVHTGRESEAAGKEYTWQRDLYEGKKFDVADPKVKSAYEAGSIDFFKIFDSQADKIVPYDGPWPAMVKLWAENDLGVKL